jgi:NAD(P)-dependent dehydrogenase (short-subunit alcohol dehydrogenase family)
MIGSIMDAVYRQKFVFIKQHTMSGIFENKKVIIAGGSSGIGLATAVALKKQQAVVTVTGRNAEKLQQVQQATGLQTQALDSTDRTASDAFFKKAGNIDHLVISVSGGKGMGNFSELSLNDLREGFEHKFWPQLNTLQAALPYINKTGSITLITAISSMAGLPGTSGLAAINGALELMVPIIAKEIKPVRLNAVSPGVVDTPWWSFLPQEAKQKTFEQFSTTIPLARVATAEEIAHAVIFTLGNSYLTGTVVPVDGGVHC